jgi:hypothetical protein
VSGEFLEIQSAENVRQLELLFPSLEKFDGNKDRRYWRVTIVNELFSDELRVFDTLLK